MTHCRLLHVDPDPLARYRLKQRLPAHFDLVALGAPDAAHRAFDRIRPRIVLASVHQVGTSGPALCRSLRNAGYWGRDSVLIVYGPSKDISQSAVDLMVKIRFGIDHVLLDATTDDLIALVNKIGSDKYQPVPREGRWKRMLGSKTAKPDRVVRSRPLSPAPVVSARLPEGDAESSWSDLLTSPVNKATIHEFLTKPIASAN